jgi:hypothetical protein
MVSYELAGQHGPFAMTHSIVRRSRLIFVPLIFAVLLAALWTAFWFYTASAAETAIAAWREREAKVGRIYTCGSQTIGGFPFRIEVRCANVAAEFRTMLPAIAISAKSLVVVAQLYQSSHLIAEVSGPLAIGEPGRPATLMADWSLAQASVEGMPLAPQRVSLVIDRLRLERSTPTTPEALANAERTELHARLSAGSIFADPVLDIAARLAGLSLSGVKPLAGRPFDAESTIRLRGLKDLLPKPLSVMLKEFQAAGGRLEVTRARAQQGDTIAVATGDLGLSARARLDGLLRVTVAGLEQFVAALGGFEWLAQGLTAAGSDRAGPSARGLDRLAPVLGGLERLLPGIGGLRRDRAELGILALLGERTELEGRQAVAMPLRFSDGAVSLGPIPLGQTPPLF